MTRYVILTGVVLSSFVFSMHAVEITSRTFIEPKDVFTVGDVITYQIVLELTNKESCTLEQPKLPPHLEMEALTPEQDGRIFTITARFRYFDPSIQQMPDMTVMVSQGKGTPKPFVIPGLPLISQSVLTDQDTDIVTIRPPKSGLTTNYSYWPLIGTIVGIAALIFLIVWLFNRWRKRPYKEKKPEIWEQQIDSLEYLCTEWRKISVEKAVATHREKKLYYDVTEILRTFLSLEYKKNYIDMTTREFRFNFRESLSKQYFERVCAFFEYADTVKFAKVLPDDNAIAEIPTIMQETITLFTQRHAVVASEVKK